jgi:hypothetical protein
VSQQDVLISTFGHFLKTLETPDPDSREPKNLLPKEMEFTGPVQLNDKHDRQNEPRTWIEFGRENPSLVTAGVVGAAATGGFLLVPPLLSVAGFTAIGPAAGSFAASWMSSIGVVQAGSAYGVIQSVAMGGAYATTVQGGAAAITGGLAYLGMGTRQPPEEPLGEPPEEPTSLLVPTQI